MGVNTSPGVAKAFYNPHIGKYVRVSTCVLVNSFFCGRILWIGYYSLMHVFVACLDYFERACIFIYYLLLMFINLFILFFLQFIWFKFYYLFIYYCLHYYTDKAVLVTPFIIISLIILYIIYSLYYSLFLYDYSPLSLFYL